MTQQEYYMNLLHHLVIAFGVAGAAVVAMAIIVAVWFWAQF